MFAWGSTINGELGLGGIEDEHILTPRKLDWYLANKVIECALGDNHTLFLTKGGRVFSCGNNDYGQLGHDQPRKRPQEVTGLDAHNITHVACGATHSMALNQWGQVFSWGSDYHGQLGQELGENIQAIPKIVRTLARYHIVQVACGQRHTVALTDSGDILSWGANSFGQLGIGLFSPSEIVPKRVDAISGLPFVYITCGANHTFAISKSGAVFGWGKNTRGQLGINDMENKMFPTQLRTLRNLKIRYVACGEEFSVFLTLDGGVFTCGSGSYGQLGHGSASNEILPRQVIELMGSTITQIACGRQHCLALVPSRGRVYSFGIGGSGQLGVRKTNSAYTPLAVLGPWVSPNGSALIPLDNKNSPLLVIHRVFAGGDHCFVSVVPQEKKIPAYDSRDYDPQTQILNITHSYIKTLLRIPTNGPVDQDVISFLETAFKSLACLNGSFLIDEHYYCTSKHHGVDMQMAEKIFSDIGKIENESIQNLIWSGLTNIVRKQLVPDPPDVEALRIYLVLPLYHEFNNSKQFVQLQKPFASAMLRLKESASKIVGQWWSKTTTDYFERLINIFKNVASYIMRNQNIPQGRAIFYDAALVAMLDMMAYLNKLNHNVPDGLKVPFDIFHINDLHDYLDVRVDYVLWLMDNESGKLYLCNYPFVFDAHAKLKLLETDQSMQMQSAMHNAAQQAVLAALFSPSRIGSINHFLSLNISRDHIVEDTLRELGSVNPADLKKPLKIKFSGEEAEDAGGVTKEFFMLLLRDILDPKYGMFKEYEETRAIWFSEISFEDNNVYFLIGMICGLAIYNFTIIDIPFPLALYKKLLGERVVLNDLKDLSPAMLNSLKSLLEYADDDFQDVFSLSFDINRDVWGEITTVELKPNGSNILVNQENKEEYVKLYVEYIFNKSVENQYLSFHDGFMKVCDGRVLQLFHSQELMAIVVGNENYDWHALEEAAEYKNGYKSSDPTIRYFWEVLHEMSLEDKKKFLLFLTGTYRIPIQGMKAIRIIIQPTLDDKFLPVAHTCFNLLDLPRYKTKERLKYKLMQAIQQTQGFSLV